MDNETQENQVENPPILINSPQNLQNSKDPKPLGSKVLSKKNVEDEARELKANRTLPTVPGKVCSSQETTSWLSLLTPEMWDRLMPYVYRTYPIINRKSLDPDANKYIDVISRDSYEANGNGIQEYIKRIHGGGKFNIYINDVYADREKPKLLFECKVSIGLDDVMPILNYTELDFAEKTNLGYLNLLRTQGIIDEKNRIISKDNPYLKSAQPQQQQTNSDPAAMITAMGGMFQQFLSFANKPEHKGKAEDSLTALFLEKMKQDNPNQANAAQTQMLDLVKAVLSKPESKPEFGLKEMFAMMQDAKKENMEMFKMMLEHNKPIIPIAQPDSLDTIIKLRTALPELFNNSGQSRSNDEPLPKTTAEVVMEAAKEFLPGLIGLGSQILQIRTGAKPIIPTTVSQAEDMVNGVVQQPGTSLKPTNLLEQAKRQQNQAQDSNLNTNTNTNINTNTKVVQMPDPNLVQQARQELEKDPMFSLVVANIWAQFGLMITNAIKTGMDPVDAGDLVKANAKLIGQDIHAILMGQGVDKIIYTMKAIPEIWKDTGEIYGEVKMTEFIEKFINFENYELQDSEEGTQV